MPDISMCQNYDCPLKKRCYRMMAVPHPTHQSYAVFEYDDDGCGCGCFIGIRVDGKIVEEGGESCTVK